MVVLGEVMEMTLDSRNALWFKLFLIPPPKKKLRERRGATGASLEVLEVSRTRAQNYHPWLQARA